MQWKFMTEQQKPNQGRKGHHSHSRLSRAEALKRICERIKKKNENRKTATKSS